MSLRHTPEERISRKVLQAVAGAIKSLETVTGTVVEYDISKDDAVFLCSAMSDLWTILYSNGYTIDIDTNRLRRAKP
jgi:hypothetical protein